LKSNEKDYSTYLKSNVPEDFHYGENDDTYNRIGDILIVAKWPRVFNLKNRKLSPGWHGYPPTKVNYMHATFYAWEPAFKNKIQITSFANVHIYPMVAQVLGLTVTEKIDGKKEVLNPILKKPNKKR
jgi:hypothetical protein